MESKEKKKSRAQKILLELKKNYPRQPNLFLNHSNDAQMLCAIMLSAQSTDTQINKVTKRLFEKYKTIDYFASAKQRIFEKEIFSSGFYKNKAKNIIATFKKIKNEFNGSIPLTMSELISLPGIGRKTANLVLLNKGIISGIAVDVHVFRLSKRFGLTTSKTPNKVEQDLIAIYQKTDWQFVNKLFIVHGRAVCTARNPNCVSCFLNKKNLCTRVGVQK